MEKNSMMMRKAMIRSLSGRMLAKLLPGFLFLAASASACFLARAQEAGQRTFPSPEDAARAFYAASRAQDDQALLAILGPQGKEIISSGDSTEDAISRQLFTEKYEEMHRFAPEPDGSLTLYVGAENWPLPIPLVSGGGNWYFNTQTAKNEILFRRIGRNELAAMDACLELVQAETQYFSHPPDGSANQYTTKLLSGTDHRDGLYQEGRFDTLLDPLIAYAIGKDADHSVGEQAPYDGYFFRVLTTQGAHAPGGARNYVVGGQMTGGFAIIASPAAYRSSGVMTFIVGQNGIIYQKDLGPETKALAESMTAFDPDSTWQKAKWD